MSDDLNREEVEEAITRVFADGGHGLDDDAVEAGLEEAVENGWLTKDGDNYKMTEAGKTHAEQVMRDALEDEPPRQDAEAHMYLKLQQVCEDDETLQVFFAAGKDILRIEHYRLADRLEEFSDEWAAPLADLIRRGAL